MPSGLSAIMILVYLSPYAPRILDHCLRSASSPRELVMLMDASFLILGGGSPSKLPVRNALMLRITASTNLPIANAQMPSFLSQRVLRSVVTDNANMLSIVAALSDRISILGFVFQPKITRAELPVHYNYS